MLRSNIINYTRNFLYIWDEVTFTVANESDLGHAGELVRRIAKEKIGDRMARPAEEYRRLLREKGLVHEVATEPQVFLSLADSWTNLTVRYIVPVRERRQWSSDLILAVSKELAKPEHSKRVINAYPRTQVQFLAPDGRVRQPPGAPTGSNG